MNGQITLTLNRSDPMITVNNLCAVLAAEQAAHRETKAKLEQALKDLASSKYSCCPKHNFATAREWPLSTWLRLVGREKRKLDEKSERIQEPEDGNQTADD